MTDAYIGEIQAFAFGYYPQNWLPCDGRILPIPGNSTLFSLIGASYGGNGTTNFALPNLVGQVAMSQGQGPGLPYCTLGESVGEAGVTLAIAEMPAHTHGLQLANPTTNSTTAPSATSNTVINPGFNGFVVPPPNTNLAANAVAATGNSQPHPNTQPTLAMIYCICISGIFPNFGTA